MTEEQMIKMRTDMIDDLLAVVDNYRTEVGCGMSASDVVGALEWCKMEVFMESNGDSLLRHTSYSLD